MRAEHLELVCISNSCITIMLVRHCPMYAARLTVVFDQPFFEKGCCHSPADEPPYKCEGLHELPRVPLSMYLHALII